MYLHTLGGGQRGAKGRQSGTKLRKPRGSLATKHISKPIYYPLCQLQLQLPPSSLQPSSLQPSSLQPSSLQPFCPCSSLPCPALRPLRPPAFTTGGGFGFLPELLVGRKSTKTGGVPRHFGEHFCRDTCFAMFCAHRRL